MWLLMKCIATAEWKNTVYFTGGGKAFLQYCCGCARPQSWKFCRSHSCDHAAIVWQQGVSAGTKTQHSTHWPHNVANQSIPVPGNIPFLSRIWFWTQYQDYWQKSKSHHARHCWQKAARGLRFDKATDRMYVGSGKYYNH